MKEKNKKKIIWITPDYFYDVDWPIVSHLNGIYDIRWYVIWGKNSLLSKPHNSNIYKYIVLPYRNRDIRIVKFYLSLIQEMKNYNPSIIYNGFSGAPFFYPLLFYKFDRNIIIQEGHEIDPWVSIEHKRPTIFDKFISSYMKYYLRRVGHTQVFSKHAEIKFHHLYPGRQCTYIPMVPKDFGRPKGIVVNTNKVVFLFFGKVYRTLKRFDLLLDAFLALDNKYLQKSELWVYGKCDGEERIKYEKMIEGRDNIKAMFDFVPNEIIPDLFCSASYLVQPYQKITQSGPMMIAYNYNLPVIASNIDGFKERIDDGKNGYLFEVNNVDALKSVLENCIEQNESEYNWIRENVKTFVEKEYSSKVIFQKYCKMLDSMIKDDNM